VFDESNTPALRNSRVTSLFESPDGTLWIGDESGQITQYKEGRFQAVGFHPTWTGGEIYAIASDESGTIWAMNGNGQLARVKDGLVLTPKAGVLAGLVGLTRSAQATILVSRDGRVAALAHNLLQPLWFGSTDATYPYVQGIGASRDGGLWLAVDGETRKWKDGRWVENLGSSPWGRAAVTRMLELRNGTLAVGTPDNGLFLIYPGQPIQPRHFNHATGFPSDWITTLCEDREGNLWVGTGGGGLVLVRPNNIETVAPPDQWQGRAVLSVWPGRADALWVGTEGAGLYRFKGGQWTSYRTEQVPGGRFAGPDMGGQLGRRIVCADRRPF
jgi:ligand-binding sensor domain-containing protein